MPYAVVHCDIGQIGNLPCLCVNYHQLEILAGEFVVSEKIGVGGIGTCKHIFAIHRCAEVYDGVRLVLQHGDEQAARAGNFVQIGCTLSVWVGRGDSA